MIPPITHSLITIHSVTDCDSLGHSVSDYDSLGQRYAYALFKQVTQEMAYHPCSTEIVQSPWQCHRSD